MSSEAAPAGVDRDGRPWLVLHVIDSLGSLGGAERGLVQEIVRFPSARSVVVVLFDRAPLRPALEAAGVEVVELGLAHGGLHRTLPVAVRRVAGEVRRRKPDVVHTSLFHGNLVGQWAAAITRRPVVSTLVSSGLRYDAGAQGSARRRKVLLGLARAAAWVSRARWRAITHHAADSNATVFGIDPAAVTVVPRGIDPERFAPAPDGGAPPHLEGRPALINVGRHFPAKAQWDLIAAMPQVLSALPEARLRIVGEEGPTSDRLRAAIAEHGVGDAVVLQPTVEDIVPLLRGSDVFTFSSHHEGLGTAVLEALAVGLPVVSFDLPSVREVTDDGRVATLVPMGDVDALARAIVEVAATAGDADAAAERRRWVCEHYDADVVAAQVEAVLLAAIARHR